MASPAAGYRSAWPRALARANVTPWALGALLAMAGALAQAQGDPRGRDGKPGPARTEAQWLQAIQVAAQRVNFAGTIVYQQGGAVRASRIVHYFDGADSHERLQMLDGQRREFIRRNEEVQCLFPDARRVQVDTRPSQDAFPAIGAGAPAEILERYQLRIGGLERVAGLDCQVLDLEPRDALRYGYRLCVEAASALLLRAQTLNERREVIEQMAFADVRIGERMDRAMLRPSWSTEGWRVERSEYRSADLARSGWVVSPPAGFRKLREVERKMGKGEQAHAVLQAVYSDGLATLSVFVEASTGAAHAQDMARSQGATSAYLRRIGDALVTVIGEVPPATAKAAALSVEYRQPK